MKKFSRFKVFAVLALTVGLATPSYATTGASRGIIQSIKARAKKILNPTVLQSSLLTPVLSTTRSLDLFNKPAPPAYCQWLAPSPRGFSTTASKPSQPEKTPAQKVVERQERVFDSLFSTTGYSTWQEFQDDVAKAEARDPELRKIHDEVKNGDLVFAIAAHNSERNSIFSEGLKNQFETKASKGLFDNRARTAVERGMLNMDEDQYDELDYQDRAKYGELLTKDQLNEVGSFVQFYGDDYYVLKNERIQHRVTWTPGDSLNRTYDKAERLGVDPSQGQVLVPAGWEDIFIPWSKRDLLLPFLSKKTIQSPELRLLQHQTHFLAPNLHFSRVRSSSKMGGETGYVEFQVWGEVSLSDIDTFVFTQKLPSIAMMQFLARNGIRVLDGRRQ